MSNKFAATFAAFRLYEDGTESGSTAIAAQDTDITGRDVSSDNQIHLRVRIDETGAGSVDGDTTDDWGLDHRLNGAGAWTAVTASSTRVQADTGSTLTDGNASTNRATDGISDGSGSFVAGEQEDQDGEITDHQLTADNFTEHVWALKLISADLSANDALTFRVTRNGSSIAAGVVPSVTVSKVVNTNVLPGLGTLTTTGNIPVITRFVDPGLVELRVWSVTGLQLQGITPQVIITETGDKIITVPTGILMLTGNTSVITRLVDVPLASPAPTFTGAAPSAEIIHIRGPPLQTLLFDGKIPVVSRLVDVPLGTLLFTGNIPVINRLVDVPTGTLLFTGNTPAPSKLVDVGAPDALLLAGAAPTVQISVIKEVPLASPGLQFSSDAPTAFEQMNEQPLLGTLLFTGNIPVISRLVDAGAPDTLLFSSVAPTVTVGFNITVPVGALQFDGKVPVPSKLVDAGAPDSLIFTGGAPSVEIEHNRSVSLASPGLQFSSVAPIVLVSKIVEPGLAQLQFTGNIPVPSKLIDAGDPDSLLFTGFAPTADVTADAPMPGTGSLVFSPSTPSAEIDHFRATGAPDALITSSDAPIPTLTNRHLPAELVLTGQQPSIVINHIALPTLGSIVFTGNIPDLLQNSIRVPTTGSILFTGAVPSVEFDFVRDVGTGSITFTGTFPLLGPSQGSITFSSDAPTLNIANSGLSVTNPNAITAVPNNYEQCDITGFRQMPGSMKLQWNKYAVRQKSFESRHPMEYQKNPSVERRKGSKRAEQDDRFIGDEIDAVEADDY